MTEIPRTDNVDVAKVAVAWEITKMSVMGTDEYIAAGGLEKRKLLVGAFGPIYKVLSSESWAVSSQAAQFPQAGQAAQAAQSPQAGQEDDGGIMGIRNSFTDS